MRTTIFLLFSALSPGIASAQTYFHIGSIAVQPNDPTTSDEISIALSGGLSSTGAYVISTDAVVQGNILTITIDAADDGGATVIVPHTEVVPIGQLPAGEYMIEINGSFVLDMASPGQHFFAVGGDPCELLEVASVEWAPFSDTAMVVHVFNNSSELFDYPGFVLLDLQGDTIASEAVDYFGIGAESYHTLRIHPNTELPTVGSMVQLHLWTGFYSEQACAWNLPFDPCPPMPCDSVVITLDNFGGALTLGDFVWIVRNSSFEVVADGTFTLTTSIQSVQAMLCLAPGSYAYECGPQQAPTGGQPFFGVRSTGWISGPSAPVAWSLPVPLSFEFLPACEDGTNAILEGLVMPEIAVTPDPSGIRVARRDGKPPGTVMVFDATGRSIGHSVDDGPYCHIDLSDVASGVLLVRAGGTVQRIVWTSP